MSFTKLKKVVALTMGTMLAVSGLALGGGSMTHAAGSAKDVNVTLHKLKFETMPGDVQNTGEELSDTEIVTNWGANVPLEGVTFEAYDVTKAYHDAYKAAFTGNNHAAAAAAAVSAVQGTAGTVPTTTPAATKVNTQKTDTDGEASFATLPGTSGGQDAVYVFVETGTPTHTVVGQKSHNLVLALPVKDSSDAENTNIHLYPKNAVSEPEMEIDKDRDKYDHEIGARVPYWIEADVPTNIDSTYVDADDNNAVKPSYTQFDIIDTHSTQLTFDKAAGYTLKTTTAPEKTLVDGTDYNITAESATGFTVKLTQAGINKLENTDGKLRFEYKMYLNGTSAMDTAYVNKAQVITNFHNEETEETEVGTGGYRFIKQDANTDNPIEGAVFVVRDNDDDSAKYLVVDPTTKEISWSASAGDATEFTSGSDGKFEVKGLDDGTYWLEEKTAPTGYEQLKDRIDFTVHCGGETGDATEGSYTKTTAIPSVVENVRKGFLPSTGGKGIVAIMAVGILSITIGVAYFGKKRFAA